MRTTFTGLEIGQRGLQAQQRSLDVTGHNVANVNTPGYSRQRPLHESIFRSNIPGVGTVGHGAKMARADRMRDEFVESRLRDETHSHQYWNTRSETMEQVELIFNEPSENNIHQSLENFWDSLQELSKQPENQAFRQVLIQRSEALIDAITSTRQNLGDLRDNMDALVPIRTDRINVLASQVANLNQQISANFVGGHEPNDLLDKRDEVLLELAGLTNFELVPDTAGAVTVTIGGSTLVHRSNSYALDVRPVEAADGRQIAEVHWVDTGTRLDVRSGDLAAVIGLRDQDVQQFIDELNDWTNNLIQSINQFHSQGFDLHNAGMGDPGFAAEFFLDASNGEDPAVHLRLNPDIAADSLRIAASGLQDELGQTVVGNGDIILQIAGLRYQPPAGQQTTINDQYNALIADLGVRAQRSQTMHENAEVRTHHLDNLREAVSGVNLDEEMVNLIRFQHAYAAAARVLNAMDEALDTIIHRLGLVGR